MPDERAAETWNNFAGQFDEQPDHALTDPAIRARWARLFAAQLPEPACRVLDVGCGTGSVSLLLAELGHEITGVDFAAEMIALAKRKSEAMGLAAAFAVQDAAAPDFPPQSFDVIVCRHVLWALPDPASVLARWTRLLRPGGRLLLIEGVWDSGAGMTSDAIAAALPEEFGEPVVTDLSSDPQFWGKPVGDRRYLVTAVLLRK